MTDDVMANAQHRNDKLQNRYAEELRALIHHEKQSRERKEREVQAMREDFTAQLAYQYVAKNHSFKRFYKSQQENKKQRPISDNPQLYAEEIARRQSAKGDCARPLGSLRQAATYNNELRVKFPPLADEVTSPRVSMMGGKTYHSIKHDEHAKPTFEEKKITAFPNIEAALGVEIKFRYHTRDDDKMSLISAPAADLDAEGKQPYSNTIQFDMAQNLRLLRRAEQEQFERHRRQLPVAPGEVPRPLTKEEKHEKREAWRRVLPETPVRSSTVFQGISQNRTEQNKSLLI